MESIIGFVAKENRDVQKILLNVLDGPCCVGKNFQTMFFSADNYSFAIAYNSSRSCFSDQDITLVFAGKLLCTEKIKHFLKNDNESDAEIVATLFKEKQQEAFALLEGYWSLFLFDKQQSQVFLARDHFGCKSLHYAYQDEILGFANEPIVLYRALDNFEGIDRYAVVDFLIGGNISFHQQHFYEKIEALDPSKYLSFQPKNKNLASKTYYTLPYRNCTAGFNEFDLPFHVDKIRKELINSVVANFQGRSSVAIGLSGGLDSSAIACIGKKYCPQTSITAFTATDTFDGGEASWAEIIVRQTKMDWQKVFVNSKDIENELQEVIALQNIPLFTPSSFSQYKIIEAAKKQGFETFVDGQGADEMLAGYNVFYLPFLSFLRSEWMLVPWVKELINSTNSGLSLKDISLLRLKEIAKKYYYRPSRLLAKKLPIAFDSFPSSLLQSYLCPKGEQNAKKVLNEYLYEYYTSFLPHILRWGERSAAAFSMDLLMPFANSVSLAQAAFQAPSTMKIHQAWSKYLLRMALTGLVDERVLWRKKKMGFYVPQWQWLKSIEATMFALLTEKAAEEDLLDINKVLQVWKKHFRASDMNFVNFVFRIYSYLLWKDFLKKDC